MLLGHRNAVIYGGGGAVGSAVARAFAREGASVFLAGRTLARVEAVAGEIGAAGGVAEAARVDAHDEPAVERHLDAVADRAGGIDVLFNAIGMEDIQGTALVDMRVEDFMHPVLVATRTQFHTARAAARHMVERGSGAPRVAPSRGCGEGWPRSWDPAGCVWSACVRPGHRIRRTCGRPSSDTRGQRGYRSRRAWPASAAPPCSSGCRWWPRSPASRR